MFLILLKVCECLQVNFIPATKTPPSPRTLSCMSHMKLRSSLILYGGWVGETNSNELWEFSLLSSTWQELIPFTSEVPSTPYLEPRCSSACISSSNHQNFYIFGGQTISGFENDLWEFDLSQMKWEKKQTNNSPSPRSKFAYTEYTEGNSDFLVIQGGTAFSETVNEMWRLNLSNFEWKLMPDAGEAPKPTIQSVFVHYEGNLLQTAGVWSITDGCFPYLYSYSLSAYRWEVISDKASSFQCFSVAQGFIYQDQLIIPFGWLSSSEVSETVLKFDLKSEKRLWSELKEFPLVPACEYSLVAVKDAVYFFGGLLKEKQTPSNKLEELNLLTFQVNQLSHHSVFPKQRTLHSMVAINLKFYVFGGVHFDEIFNDVWTFDLVSTEWIQVAANGVIPSARHSHAAAADGNVFAVWGGEDKGGLKKDLFLFNSLTHTWIEITPGLKTPLPAKGACLVIKNSKIFIFGGKTSNGISSTLWKYDMGTNLFDDVSNDLEYSSSYSHCWMDSGLFYVSLGSLSAGEPLTRIVFYNLSSSMWSVFHSHRVTKFDTSQSAQIFTDNHLISIGGQSWNQIKIDSISVLGPGNTLQIFPDELKFTIYGSASVYFKKSLFFFGGGTMLGSILLSTIGHNLLFNIDLEKICSKANCSAFCSSRTQKEGKTCEVCKKGRYTEGMNNDKCSECRTGTFNNETGASSPQQCLPCREGFFNNKTGAENCEECSKDYYCAVGSSQISSIPEKINSESIQPPLYENQDLSKSMIIYQTLVSVPLFLIMIIFFTFKKLRIHLQKIDLFDDKHDNPESEVMIKKKTKIGACFTFLVVIGALLLTCSSVLEYFKANIQETKGLVPLVVLESEGTVFEAKNLLLQVTFFSYGGECESDCFSSLNLAFENIEFSQKSVKCFNQEVNSCRIKLILNNAEINTGAMIFLSLNKSSSYSTGIEVNLTSDSSIPEQISSVSSVIQPKTGFVFIGPVATEFFFLVTPSLFRSESSRWESESKGFHVSEKNTPKAGSKFQIFELATVSNLNLKVFIEKSSTGLLTLRNLKQSFMFFVGSLLGTVTGLFGIAGFFMAFVESRFQALLKKKWKNRKISHCNDESDSTKVEKVTRSD